MHLSELCNLISDQCEPAQSSTDVYVGLEHIDSAAFQLTQHGSPTSVRSSKNRFQNGDLLYGKLRPYLDKAILADRDGICSTDILVLRPREKVCGAYLLGLIHSSQFLKHAISTTDGVNHPRTSWSAISEFDWDIPETVEQQKIGAVLWKAQRAIEAEAQLIAAARELKRSAIYQLFTRGLRGEVQQDTDIGPLPESWQVRPFEEVREFLQYGTSAKCDYHGKGNPVIRIPNIHDGKISSGDLKWCELIEREVASLELQLGDILFVRTNGVRERVGTCAIYQGQPERALFASYLIRGRLKSSELCPEFFQYFSMTAMGALQLAGRASPAADGKFNVNTKIIDSMLVPVTSSEEQHQIVEILQTIDRKISVHERKRAALQELFKTLLHQLMTGQIRVDKLDIDVSEVVDR